MASKSKKTDIIKECTVYVNGMHCASCEVLIEKKLLQQKGVESVDASLKNNAVNIFYKGNTPNISLLNKDFKEAGYRFQKKKIKKIETPLFRKNQNGSLSINATKFNSLMKTIGTVALVLALFLIVNKLELGRFISVDSNSALPSFIMLGLVAGVSSCAALVGGLLLSMVKQWNELHIAETSAKTKATPHILFHLGRLVSFSVLGGILGLIGEKISLGSTVSTAILTILVSLVMVLMALQMLEVSWAQKISITIPKKFSSYIVQTENYKGKFMPTFVGALTFFLPCGFTLIAQGVALTSGSFMQGFLIMLMFALGTFIPLAAISYSGLALNKKPHLTAKFNLVAGILIVFFAIYNINGQLNVLGLPSLNDISINFEKKEKTVEYVEINEEGKQILNFTASGFSYTPTTSINLKAGVPTVLTVNDLGIQGCGAYMAARGLFPDYVALKPGLNTIEFTPKKGTYKLTCTMGMVTPVTIRVY